MPQRFNILLFIAKSGYHFIEESPNRKVCSYLKLIDTCWFLLAKVYIGKLVNIRVLPLSSDNVWAVLYIGLGERHWITTCIRYKF